MKRLLLTLLLAAATLPAFSQNPRARDFSTAVDSLQARLQRKTGVISPFKLEKVLVRGSVLDFYFSQNMSAFPWRTEDVGWFNRSCRNWENKP